jgi:uncharacterized membrane protein
MKANNDDKPLVTSGIFLGIGLGGFVDGILFHQILQIHSMLSAKHAPDTVANLEVNMVWDGLFHTLTWIMTLTGLVLLWRTVTAGRAPLAGKTLCGAAVLGWGLFNLVEGIIDHHLLHVHHVVERLGVSIYDYLFLGSGILMIVVGVSLIRSSRKNYATLRSG